MSRRMTMQLESLQLFPEKPFNEEESKENCGPGKELNCDGPYM